jgi:hypothetical protein
MRWADVRFRPKADIPIALPNVRFWENSGHSAHAANDPQLPHAQQ